MGICNPSVIGVLSNYLTTTMEPLEAHMWNEKSIKVQNLTTLAGILSVNPEVGHRHIKGLGLGLD